MITTRMCKSVALLLTAITLANAQNIPGLGDVSDVINDFLPNFDIGAAQDCSKQADVFNKLAEECASSLNGGTINVCTKECDGFFKKAGEGDCGEFYRGLGLEYMFDICSDGKVTVQDFEDINVPDVPDVPDTITVPESTPAAVSTDSTSPASQISSADKNGIMLLASLVGAALAFSM